MCSPALHKTGSTYAHIYIHVYKHRPFERADRADQPKACAACGGAPVGIFSNIIYIYICLYIHLHLYIHTYRLPLGLMW